MNSDPDVAQNNKPFLKQYMYKTFGIRRKSVVTSIFSFPKLFQKRYHKFIKTQEL